MIEVADSAFLLGTLHGGDLLLGATGRNNCEVARKQVVTSVAVLHLDDITRDTEVLNGSGEDQFHDPCLSWKL